MKIEQDVLDIQILWGYNGSKNNHCALKMDICIMLYLLIEIFLIDPPYALEDTGPPPLKVARKRYGGGGQKSPQIFNII